MRDDVELNNNYFLCDLDPILAIAKIVQPFEKKMSLMDQLIFCKTPLNYDEPRDIAIMTKVCFQIILL
jgi:hypothetical protein